MLAIVMIATLGLTSCSKYEEGGLSLLPKTTRLTREWKLTEWVSSENGVTATTEYPYDLTMEFLSDNTTKETYVGTNILGQTITSTSTGEWRWNSDKSMVETKDEGSTAWEESGEIRKLSTSELWVRDTDTDGDYTEVHYTSK